jgi:PAS domain S-box-containing protein
VGSESLNEVRLELEAYVGGLVQALPDGILLTDRNGRIVFLNSRLEELSHYHRDDLLGRPLELLVPGGVRDANKENRFHSPDDLSLRPPVLQSRLRPRAGDEIPVDIRINPIELGGEPYTVVSVQDIRERQETEEFLRQSEERFRRIFEDGPLGIAIVDRDLTVTDVNQAVVRMTGFTREELIGTRFPRVDDPTEASDDLALMHRLLGGEIASYRIEKRFKTKTGTTAFASITTSVVHDETGRPLYTLRIVEDITERKRLEQEIATQAAAARAILGRLTAREAEILGLLSEGLSAPQMAKRLSVSHRTVESHLANAYRKLGVRTKDDAKAEFMGLARAADADATEPPT